MTEIEILPKRGAPTKYKKEMGDVLLNVAEQGGHVAQMCVALGIRSKDTFYEWVDKYPEFKKAYEEAKLVSQAFWENILLMGSLGKIKGFNFNSVAMIMNNKFSEEYKRSATGSNTEINIGAITNNTLELSQEELDAKLESIKSRLQALNYDPES